MRLIDADALMDDIKETIENSGCVNHEGEILDCIEYAPTAADEKFKNALEEIIKLATAIIEPKRGEWVEAKSGVMSVYPPGQVMCSVCGQRMPSQWKKMPPYCYGCGAKMKGEER